MNAEEYSEHRTAELLMGPSGLRILEELLAEHPLKISRDAAGSVCKIQTNRTKAGRTTMKRILR